MALSAGTVSLAVKANAAGFGANLASDISREAKSSGLSNVGKVIGGTILAGVATAVAGVSAVMVTGMHEAMDASAGNAQLAAGIKSTGNAAGVSVSSLNAMASSIQNMSGQTDDSISASQKLLLTFTNIKNNGPDKIFDQATLASANMAAKMGGDASGSAILLGKALNDPVKGITALTRVGVSFTQGQKDSIAAMVKMGDTAGAQKLILGELNTEFGGAAEAAGKSLPGMVARSKRAFEDLSQTIFEGLLPVITPALEGSVKLLQGALPAIQNFTTGVGNAFKFVAGYVSGEGAKVDVGKWERPLTTISEMMITFIGVATAVGNAVKFVAGYVSGAGAQVDVGKWEGPLTTISEMLITFIGVAKTTFNGFKPVLSAVGQLFVGLGTVFAPLMPKILALVMSFSPLSLILKTITPVLPVLVRLLTTLGTVLASNLAAVLPTIISLVGFVGQALTSLAPVVGILAVVIGQVLGAVLPVIAQLFAVLGPTIESLLPPIMQVIGVVAAVLGPVLQIIGAILVGLINLILPVLIPVIQFLAAIITIAFNVIAAVVSWAWGSVIKPVFDFMVVAVSVVGTAIGIVFGAIGDVIRGAFNGVVDFVKGIFNTIAGLVNGIIDGVNGATSLASGVGITIGRIPHIPKLAEGGIVPATPGGRLVRVAEGGQDEIVGPLDKVRNALGGSGGGLPQNITLVDADGSILARTHVISRKVSVATLNSSLRGL